MSRRPTMTDEQRAEYREAKRQDAEHRLDELLTQDGWATWLTLRKHLHRYSVTNQVLIAMQAHAQAQAAQDGDPEAPGWPCAGTPTIVKSAGLWRKDGYHQAKGTRGLYVWTRHDRGSKNAPTWKCCGGTPSKGKECPTCGKSSMYFALRPVYDASQVVSFDTGIGPQIDMPQASPITGEAPGCDLLVPLAEWALDTGLIASYDLQATSERGEGGSFAHDSRHIRVCATVDGEARSDNARLRVLIHELAHAAGITRRNKDVQLTRADAECAVECVSFIVASTAGLDTSGQAIPYIAGWGGEDAQGKVRAFARLIDETAKRLEEPILRLLDQPAHTDTDQEQEAA